MSPVLARLSPAPTFRTFKPRQRPGSLRTVVTNILHGIVLALRFVVDTLGSIVKTILNPVHDLIGSSKSVIKRARRDWWKWLGGLLALSLVLRLLNRPKGYSAPDAPPGNMDELVERLTSLEHALSSLSTSTEGLKHDNHDNKRVVKSFVDKIDGLDVEKSRLAQDYASLREDLRALGLRVGDSDRSVAAAQANLKQLNKDLQTIDIETPISYQNGKVKIDPAAWTELKAVLSDKQELSRVAERIDTSAKLPADVTSQLQQLIDTALLRYSKDTLARPDYALFTAGGRVVPSITSDTLVLRPATALGRWIGGKKDVEGRSPATALHPDNSVGSCWPFKGDKGQLGVLLNRRVVITDVTIEHAARELALDVSTAPKMIQVWGLVEGEENRAKFAAYLESHPPGSASEHLLLASIQYEPNRTPIQTFTVAPDVVTLGIDVGIVIFKVESNWGGDFTCLYRVRVHGNVKD